MPSSSADSWGIQASMAASFFTQAAVHWLRQLPTRIPMEDLRVHQNLCKIIAAAEYTADASLTTAKFSVCAIASSVTAHHMLWL